MGNQTAPSAARGVHAASACEAKNRPAFLSLRTKRA